MTTVKYASQSTDGWKDQPVIEEFLKHLLLVVQSLSFFLRGLLAKDCRGHSSRVLHRQSVQSICGGRSNIFDTGDLGRRQYRDTHDPTLLSVIPGFFEDQQESASTKKKKKKKLSGKWHVSTSLYLLFTDVDREP